MEKTCISCGGPTYNDNSLCYICLKLKEENKITQCKECGKWHAIEKECTCKKFGCKSEETETYCIICGSQINCNNTLCEDCYEDIKKYQKNYDKNNTSTKLKECYYDLQNSIPYLTNRNHKQNGCKNLIALAYMNNFYHQDKTLTQHVYDDIKDLLKT